MAVAAADAQEVLLAQHREVVLAGVGEGLEADAFGRAGAAARAAHAVGAAGDAEVGEGVEGSAGVVGAGACGFGLADGGLALQVRGVGAGRRGQGGEVGQGGEAEGAPEEAFARAVVVGVWVWGVG